MKWISPQPQPQQFLGLVIEKESLYLLLPTPIKNNARNLLLFRIPKEILCMSNLSLCYLPVISIWYQSDISCCCPYLWDTVW